MVCSAGGRHALRDDDPGQQCDPVPGRAEGEALDRSPDRGRADSREVELIAEAFGFEPPDPDGRGKADRAMAETIGKRELPADPKERRAALNAMLKPFVDRAVAACGEARQAALRSDEAGAKLANAQIEGGYWLIPLEDAANHWAVIPRGFDSPPMRPRRRPMGRGGRSSSPSATSPGVRPMSTRTSTPSSPRRGRSPDRAALLHFGQRASPPVAPEKGILVRAVLSDPERQDVQGDGIWERDAGRRSCGGAGAPLGRAGGRRGDRLSRFGRCLRRSGLAL